MALEQEFATYLRNLSSFTEHSGEWVLIKGDQVIEIFPEYEAGLYASYDRFGLEPFMFNFIDPLDIKEFVYEGRPIEPVIAAGIG